MKLTELTNQVSNLPNHERLKLANILLSLDNEFKNKPDINNLWEEEITQRVKLVESGKAIGIDFQNSIQTIRNKITQ